MDLKDMKNPPREPTAEEKRYPTMAGEQEEYPYGLQLHLDEPQLAQLGIQGTPKPGDAMTLGAKAHVVSSGETHDENGSRRSVHLQVTHLGADKGEC